MLHGQQYIKNVTKLLCSDSHLKLFKSTAVSRTNSASITRAVETESVSATSAGFNNLTRPSVPEHFYQIFRRESFEVKGKVFPLQAYGAQRVLEG
jgi:hypothetical protein